MILLTSGQSETVTEYHMLDDWEIYGLGSPCEGEMPLDAWLSSYSWAMQIKMTISCYDMNKPKIKC
jgi:hypothetical protein